MKSRKIQRLLERALRNHEGDKELATDIAYALHHVRGEEDIPDEDDMESEEDQAQRLKKIRGKLIDTMFKAAKDALKEAGMRFDYRDLFVYIYNAADHMMVKMAEAAD